MSLVKWGAVPTKKNVESNTGEGVQPKKVMSLNFVCVFLQLNLLCYVSHEALIILHWADASVAPHIETRQLIYYANQLTGFCMKATLAIQETDYVSDSYITRFKQF